MYIQTEGWVRGVEVMGRLRFLKSAKKSFTSMEIKASTRKQAPLRQRKEFSMFQKLSFGFLKTNRKKKFPIQGVPK